MKSLLFILIAISSSLASAKAQSCFRGEVNPATKVVYDNERDYQRDQDRWIEQSPSTPFPWHLVKAYGIYKKEKSLAERMPSDKRAHCYIGCRISQETNYETANYVGWLKEKRDISDCNPQTHFDEADYRATIRGALFGSTQRDSQGCLQACAQVY